MFKSLVEKIVRPFSIGLVGLIKCYQYVISPLFPRCCRFYPSCSRYTEEAILHYGCIIGSLKGIYRILSCHPWHPGGYDPVIKKHTLLK